MDIMSVKTVDREASRFFLLIFSFSSTVLKQ